MGSFIGKEVNQMKKNFIISLTITLFLISGCNQALTTSGITYESENDNFDKIEEIVHCSEAQICKEQIDSPIEEIDLILGNFAEELNTKKLTEIMEKGGNDEGLQRIILPETELAMFYRTSKPKSEKEVPVIAAMFGLGVNVTPIHGIFWYEDGRWKSQAYPKADEQVSEKRIEVFGKSNFGSGEFIEIHQKDEYMALIVNMGGGGTHYAQEVHLLKRSNGKWEIVWVPVYDNWEILWDSVVEFNNGIEEFTVHRKDIRDPNHTWEEIWKLHDEEYVLVSSNR